MIIFPPKVFDYKRLPEEKVKICLCRGNEVSGSYEGWIIQSFDESEHVQKPSVENKVEATNNFSRGFSILVKTLEKGRNDMLPDQIELQNHVEIFDRKIYDRYEKLNINKVKNVVDWLKETDFHVVHVLTRSMFKKNKAPIVVSMQSLQGKCVLVSPCVCTKRPPAPADFPCQMAIAVGLEQPQEDETKQSVRISKKNRLTGKEKQSKGEDIELHPLITPIKYQVKWQSCGSTLDFVCHQQYGEIKINNPWEASYFVTAITALILVKAYALGEY